MEPQAKRQKKRKSKGLENVFSDAFVAISEDVIFRMQTMSARLSHMLVFSFPIS